ncbi:Homeobox protein araucan [Zancudomyces culisetae]|uniref:Homeobox protein araucan n=1 Tax=Zancudomyces culisetae TaxID=1213189 RepID=A0A1R1PJP1_ZANCU|nr:Homeobox protein araucan [Zancudomyces culisetae]|eukprot:OMH81186.1 Homeobox protein araucan [Zancudomyces culisetae]
MCAHDEKIRIPKIKDLNVDKYVNIGGCFIDTGIDSNNQWEMYFNRIVENGASCECAANISTKESSMYPLDNNSQCQYQCKSPMQYPQWHQAQAQDQIYAAGKNNIATVNMGCSTGSASSISGNDYSNDLKRKALSQCEDFNDEILQGCGNKPDKRTKNGAKAYTSHFQAETKDQTEGNITLSGTVNAQLQEFMTYNAPKYNHSNMGATEVSKNPTFKQPCKSEVSENNMTNIISLGDKPQGNRIAIHESMTFMMPQQEKKESNTCSENIRGIDYNDLQERIKKSVTAFLRSHMLEVCSKNTNNMGDDINADKDIFNDRKINNTSDKSFTSVAQNTENKNLETLKRFGSHVNKTHNNVDGGNAVQNIAGETEQKSRIIVVNLTNYFVGLDSLTSIPITGDKSTSSNTNNHIKLTKNNSYSKDSFANAEHVSDMCNTFNDNTVYESNCEIFDNNIGLSASQSLVDYNTSKENTASFQSYNDGPLKCNIHDYVNMNSPQLDNLFEKASKPTYTLGTCFDGLGSKLHDQTSYFGYCEDKQVYPSWSSELNKMGMSHLTPAENDITSILGLYSENDQSQKIDPNSQSYKEDLQIFDNVIRGLSVQSPKRAATEDFQYNVSTNVKSSCTELIEDIINSVRDNKKGKVHEFGASSQDESSNDRNIPDSMSNSSHVLSYAGSKKTYTKKNTAHLIEWILENYKNPYPGKQDKKRLASLTNLTHAQIVNWFSNARRRFLQKIKVGGKIVWKLKDSNRTVKKRIGSLKPGVSNA